MKNRIVKKILRIILLVLVGAAGNRYILFLMEESANRHHRL